MSLSALPNPRDQNTLRQYKIKHQHEKDNSVTDNADQIIYFTSICNHKHKRQMLQAKLFSAVIREALCKAVVIILSAKPDLQLPTNTYVQPFQ